ncbi:coiled-coil domain-containing protein 124-like [Hydractinia symbiolongicarpus]|uniref:coiled-coil domain-containing protein 124-like n=1 Tax=Hydractinia symbiolongicarpus TaxID=13093 RepID=UPI00254D2BB1|nr:coiled-coil domain-containing protein 124-like [Hydractinia symbiolongicarpus]
MPKKNSSWGVNTKAAEARERKNQQKVEEQAAKQKAKDDAYWLDENKMEQRKKEKKDREQQKKEELLAKKLDAKKLLEEEEKGLHSSAPSKGKVVTKVTLSDIEKIKEKERKRREHAAMLREKEKKKITENPVVEEENPNRKMAELLAEEGAVEARSVNDAISVLSISGGDSAVPVDRHPEKRMKAAYSDFEERELPRLKAENPNLRLSQLKQLLRKEWQKSPDNPMNNR